MNNATTDLIIEAGQNKRQYWRDLWTYRELFLFLAWRDILVRYKQTAFGVLWAILRPLSVMLILTFVFGKLAKMPSEGVPYPVLVLTAMLPWQFFANSFSNAGNSLIANTSLISKIYFPRIIIPASTIVVSLVDFLVSATLLLVLIAWYDVELTWRLATLPCFILIAMVFSLGAGIFVSALNVKYRDFRYIVPFVVQIGLYISPVGFNSAILPEEWRLIFSLNPMAGVIDGFRWAILGIESALYLPGFLMSLGFVLLLFLSALKYFHYTENSFADVI